MSTQHTPDSHSAFEKAVAAIYGPKSFRRIQGDGDYADTEVAALWQLWSAAKTNGAKQ